MRCDKGLWLRLYESESSKRPLKHGMSVPPVTAILGVVRILEPMVYRTQKENDHLTVLEMLAKIIRIHL